MPLTDDIGLGQTVQVIALLLLGRRARADPSLLVLSASLSGNWQAHVGGRNGSRQTCASSWPYGSEHAPGELPRIVGTVITDLPGRRRRCARKQGALYQGAVAGSRRELETVVDGIKRSGLVHTLARGDRGESALSMTFTTSRSMGFQWSRDT